MDRFDKFVIGIVITALMLAVVRNEITFTPAHATTSSVDFRQEADRIIHKVKSLQKTVGSDTVEVLNYALDWDLLDYGTSPTNDLNAANVAGTESSDIDCLGKSLIRVWVIYSANNVTAPFCIYLKDASGNKIYSENITPTNKAIAVTGGFQATLLEYSVGGATSFGIRLTGTPTNSGTVIARGTAT